MVAVFLPWLVEHWRVLGAFSYLVLRIWLQRRTIRYSRELLARQAQRHTAQRHSEQRRHFEAQNETLRITLTAFANEEPRTLDDLLSHAERDWSLRSSQESSRSSRPPPPPREPTWDDSHARTEEWRPTRTPKR